MLDQDKGAMVAVIGKPNVGKSTLVNKLLGRKLSITSKRPQTTRRRVMGIGTFHNTQLAFFDTPGMHKGQKRQINAMMNKQASQSLDFADIVLWVIEAGKLSEEDRYIAKFLDPSIPTILVINKIDKLQSTSKLLPFLASVNEQLKEASLAELVPVSAQSGDNTDHLISILSDYAPHKEHLFTDHFETDQPESFFLAELVREKVIRLCGMEVPHQLGVNIELLEEEKKYIRIDAVIQVEQQGQKAIVIGSKGQKLKSAGTMARLDMEKWLGKKVMLSLWVKVKPGWSNNVKSLQELGYSGSDI